MGLNREKGIQVAVYPVFSVSALFFVSMYLYKMRLKVT
jgi:hypothetical protein